MQGLLHTRTHPALRSPYRPTPSAPPRPTHTTHQATTRLKVLPRMLRRRVDQVLLLLRGAGQAVVRQLRQRLCPEAHRRLG